MDWRLGFIRTGPARLDDGCVSGGGSFLWQKIDWMEGSLIGHGLFPGLHTSQLRHPQFPQSKRMALVQPPISETIVAVCGSSPTHVGLHLVRRSGETIARPGHFSEAIWECAGCCATLVEDEMATGASTMASAAAPAVFVPPRAAPGPCRRSHTR